MCSGRNEATIRLKQPKLRNRNNDVEFFLQDRQIMINQIDKFEIEKKKKEIYSSYRFAEKEERIRDFSLSS